MSLPVQICSVSQNWHHVGLLYSISEVINRQCHADLIKKFNVIMLELSKQSRAVYIYIGKNKNDYSSISFCIMDGSNNLQSKWTPRIPGKNIFQPANVTQ